MDPEAELQTEVAAVPDAPAPDAGEVKLGRDMSDRIRGIRIRDQNPYGYAPRFSATYVLGTSATDANGPRLAPWSDTVCTKGRHHCALALPQASVQSLPNAAERWVNLVVTADANGKNARSWDVMDVEKNHGALAVTRLGPGAGGPILSESTSDLRTTGNMGIDRPKEDGDPTQVRHLLYQLKLDGLESGDIVDAGAKMHAVLGNGFTCDPLITGQLILTAGKNAREAKGPHDEILGPKNGSNCPDHTSDGCRYEKSGAARVRNGAPSTMFLSYVAVALRSCAAPGGGDKWHAKQNGGGLDARVRR